MTWRCRATPTAGGAPSSALVRFIVLSSRRGAPERRPDPVGAAASIPSTDAEMAGARLHMMIPQDYPPGLEIPVVTRVEDQAGTEQRVNGWVNSAGTVAAPFRIVRGVGHGFLPQATAGLSILYAAQLKSLQTNKPINIDAVTTWTPISGILGASTVWPPNSTRSRSQAISRFRPGPISPSAPARW